MAALSSHQGELQCPHCLDQAPPMTRWGLAPSKDRPAGYQVDGCTTCGGAWLESQTLKAMLAEAAELVGKVTVVEANVKRRVVAETSGPITYRRCPVCKDMMARKNFERVSGIIIDTCIDHGTFFDTGELQDVLSFVRSGGLVLAQQKRAAQDARLSAEEANARKTPTTMSGPTGGEAKAMMLMGMQESPSILTRGVGDIALAVLRWGARWAWRAAKTVADARHDR
jgi:Zn-finger nucleic acid-binding protein